MSLERWLSRIWPVPVERFAGRFGRMQVCWEGGRLVLNSATGNQSFGNLHRVWQLVFRRLNLARNPPGSVLLLGLGGGSVPAILRQELGLDCPITAVEIDEAMIAAGKRHFGLDRWPGLTIVHGDAIVQAHALRERFDLVVVDLFEDLDLARGADTMGFAHALRERCANTLCFNTVAHDSASQVRCERVRANLSRAFLSVDEMRLLGVNRVFIAR